MIEVEAVDHIGVRVADLDRALSFYAHLGFALHYKASGDAVAIIKNKNNVEINLIYNANNDNGGKNILMDMKAKYTGYTHIALRVTSISETIDLLNRNNVKITQGPVDFGDGQLSVFIRDPDRNVIELRGREQETSVVEGVAPYIP